MKILFAGGGTLGPVMPLLAVVSAWKKKDPSATFVWVGTAHGPERAFVEKEGIPFFTLPVARLPRYPSLEWVTFPFKLIAAKFKACWILLRERPHIIASGGGYTAVPLVWVGFVMGIPSWIHQSDVVPVLSNRLCAPAARCITVAWQLTLRSFPKKKTMWIGNPVREELLHATKDEAVKFFLLDATRPTVLAVGG